MEQTRIARVEKKRSFRLREIKKNIFVACMLAYPVLQFAILWAFVNIDSVTMTFQRFNTRTGWSWVGLANYKNLFELIRRDKSYGMMFVNSAMHSVVGMFVIFPLCLLMSYFLCRKVPLSGFFRIVFYLPSIIPLVVLVLGFRNMMTSEGLIGQIWKAFGHELPSMLTPPKVRYTVYIFTIWAGLGGNLLLLSGSIKRVPTEVIESAHLDGIGVMGEFFRIVVPMIWPTMVTMFVMSMMGCFSVVFQPLFLTDRLMQETNTVGLWIFNNASNRTGNVQAATLGMLCTVVVAPIILLTRWVLDNFFRGIDY